MSAKGGFQAKMHIQSPGEFLNVQNSETRVRHAYSEGGDGVQGRPFIKCSRGKSDEETVLYTKGLRLVIHNQGQCCSQETKRECPETFLFVTISGDRGRRGQGRCLTCDTAQDSPLDKGLISPKYQWCGSWETLIKVSHLLHILLSKHQ